MYELSQSKFLYTVHMMLNMKSYGELNL